MMPFGSRSERIGRRRERVTAGARAGCTGEIALAYGNSTHADAPPIGRLAPDRLLRRCAIENLRFETTADLGDADETVGQQRAVDALGFGIAIDGDGYNVFAMGPEGVGRRTLARRFLERAAAGRPVPSDWCYVFDFRAPHRPRAIALPSGRGIAFKRDMQRLIEDLRATIPAAFETDEYGRRKQEIENELTQRQHQGLEAVGEHARQQGIGFLRTPGGFGFAPLVDGEVAPPEKFQALPDEEKQRIEQAIAGLQTELEDVIQTVPKWRRETLRRLRELDHQVMRQAIDAIVEPTIAAYDTLPPIVEYLGEVRADLLDHAQWLRQPDEGEPAGVADLLRARTEPETPLRRYEVNLLVDRGQDTGAPIVYEDNPTHDNLVGRIEHVAHMGALTTDFTLIKAGALHRANGGYLILDARRLLAQPFAWEALERALLARDIRTEPLGRALGLIGTQALEPQPIPLDVKVILVGHRWHYYLLHALDPEFGKLFKVAADFDEHMERTIDAETVFARLVARMANRNRLRAFDRAAVARTVEHASRRSGSAERLCIEMNPLLAVLTEANHWAGTHGRAVVTAEDVQQALDAQLHRADRAPALVRDEMLRGRLLVATEGVHVGQVNGISVAQLAGEMFGIPVRITARVRLGGGGLVDIERESQLGGPIHSKGVLILAGYLAAHYAPSKPLSLSATVVFEQTYGTVEGDSASLAELYALLSAVADVPLSNAIAITGSVNQHGDVQAIGGVNEKVEGYFDLCDLRGLTGRQGVIIPSANVAQLMLREDIVAAVAAGRFSVYAVQTVDEGFEILAGMPAGKRDALGHFPGGTLNAVLEERLADFAERARSFGAPHERRQRHRGEPK
jgi:lon-related putative ATP-dependent protease